MEYKWNIRPVPDQNLAQSLSKDLNSLNLGLVNILINRGIDSFEKAKKYFRPSLKDTHDPFLMLNMEKAVNRLNLAIERNEKILIYGDYDVDGTTSVALVYSYLKNHYENLDYYIPDRYKEGYGISFQSIDYAYENNISLIIALDCGIKAIDKIEYAKEKNIDYIICDHHLPGDKIPEASAVLDPKQGNCNYPFKGLSGCGVGYKFMEAWTIKNGLEKVQLLEQLDLLAISTCADIVPITDENRIFVYHGLEFINQQPRLGIKTMLEQSSKQKETTSVMDVVFGIAPRINAAGRIKSGKKAVEMLISDCPIDVVNQGTAINKLNSERKDLDRAITREALEMIIKDPDFKNKKTTVVFDSNWHKGVIGIVASRLIENYYRPTIVLTESEGKITGSARSVEGFDVYEAISECSDLLIQYGGHTAAAGLTMKKEDIEKFASKFDTVVSNLIKDDQLIPQINIDGEIQLSDITNKFYRILKQMEPFGPENMRPTFITNNVYSTGSARIVGENHLKLTVFQEQNPAKKFDCIGFGLGTHLENIAEGVSLSIAYTIEENTWNGRTTLQLNLKDIKL